MSSFQEMVDEGHIVRLYCPEKYCTWISLPCHANYIIVEEEAYYRHHMEAHCPEPKVIRHLVKKESTDE